MYIKSILKPTISPHCPQNWHGQGKMQNWIIPHSCITNSAGHENNMWKNRGTSKNTEKRFKPNDIRRLFRCPFSTSLIWRGDKFRAKLIVGSGSAVKVSIKTPTLDQRERSPDYAFITPPNRFGPLYRH